jgi:uncharacterized membrane protein YdjX (TVP38/TMEM64 family)
MRLSPERRLILLRILAFVLVIGIMVAIFIFRDQVRELSRFGYLGAFLITLIANATIFVPIPGVWVVFAMGAVFNPFFLAIFAGLGAAAGELSGYLLGFSGQGLAERSKLYDRIYAFMDRHQRWSDLLILIMAFIPNPFFDLAGISAGTLKIPVLRFYFFCALGSILKMLAFSYGGNTFMNLWFKP